jgi:hypothetical protein
MGKDTKLFRESKRYYIKKRKKFPHYNAFM